MKDCGKRKRERILVTGSGGQLGYELLKRVPEWCDCLGVDLPDFDLADRDGCHRLVSEFRPGMIINAAAYTAVDRAESEPGAARKVNALGAGNIAAAARSAGSGLIHISTDFVFDGRSFRPYTPNDAANPLSVYGKTKLEGEREVFNENPGSSVVRTSWLYSSHGGNFVKTMLRLMSAREELTVVSDQVGIPTWAGGLAEALWRMIEKSGLAGVYHWSDLGIASWYDFAVAIEEEARELGLVKGGARIIPVGGGSYPAEAERPFYSVMDTSLLRNALGLAGEHWRVNLRKMLRELS